MIDNQTKGAYVSFKMLLVYSFEALLQFSDECLDEGQEEDSKLWLKRANNVRKSQDHYNELLRLGKMDVVK